jgi:hypothetical protein
MIFTLFTLYTFFSYKSSILYEILQINHVINLLDILFPKQLKEPLAAIQKNNHCITYKVMTDVLKIDDLLEKIRDLLKLSESPVDATTHDNKAVVETNCHRGFISRLSKSFHNSTIDESAKDNKSTKDESTNITLTISEKTHAVLDHMDTIATVVEKLDSQSNILSPALKTEIKGLKKNVDDVTISAIDTISNLLSQLKNLDIIMANVMQKKEIKNLLHQLSQKIDKHLT